MQHHINPSLMATPPPYPLQLQRQDQIKRHLRILIIPLLRLPGAKNHEEQVTEEQNPGTDKEYVTPLYDGVL